MTLTLPSFAKLNLSLQIFRPNSTGLHPLSSLFTEISLHDIIHITPSKSNSPELKLSSTGVPIPTNQNNSIHPLFEHLKPSLSHNYAIHIEKNIPTGSGMGGASSNAACIFNALSIYEDLQLSLELKQTSSHAFGSDIPFFIQGGTQHVSETGMHCTPIDNASMPNHFILIYPSIECSTPKIYRHFDTLFPNADHASSSPEIPPIGHNDLLPVVLDLYPDMRRIYTTLSSTMNYPVYLTGSGSTFFIALNSENDVPGLISQIHTLFPDFWVKHAQPIQRTACYALSISGRVQGVFYRKSCYELATQLGIKGWVQNKADGSVEAWIEGPRELCLKLIDWCKQGPRDADVQRVTTIEKFPSNFTEFEIR